MFVFLHLTYFTKHNTLQVHPFCCKWQNFILCFDWVVFQCVYTHTHTHTHGPIHQQAACLKILWTHSLCYIWPCLPVGLGLDPTHQGAGTRTCIPRVLLPETLEPRSSLKWAGSNPRTQWVSAPSASEWTPVPVQLQLGGLPWQGPPYLSAGWHHSEKPWPAATGSDSAVS